jgi:hypothetical protein
MSDDRIPLSRVAGEIRRAHGGNHTYREIYNKVLDGEVPAEQTNGRWHVGRADLPAIAKKLNQKEQA